MSIVATLIIIMILLYITYQNAHLIGKPTSISLSRLKKRIGFSRFIGANYRLVYVFRYIFLFQYLYSKYCISFLLKPVLSVFYIISKGNRNVFIYYYGNGMEMGIRLLKWERMRSKKSFPHSTYNYKNEHIIMVI